MIKGKKVILKPARQEDLPFFYKWVNNPAVTPFWYGKDKPRSMDWIIKHFTPMIQGKGSSQCWVIEVKNKPIGFMYNTPQNDDDGFFFGRIELDILIGNDKEWGKGYGTDALQTMFKYAFQKQKAERVFIIPREMNKRAIHTYQKAGFRKEGILKHYEKFEGKWIDCVMMSIVKEEFEK